MECFRWVTNLFELQWFVNFFVIDCDDTKFLIGSLIHKIDFAFYSQERECYRCDQSIYEQCLCSEFMEPYVFCMHHYIVTKLIMKITSNLFIWIKFIIVSYFWIPALVNCIVYCVGVCIRCYSLNAWTDTSLIGR